jgi:hypothetical protein
VPPSRRVQLQNCYEHVTAVRSELDQRRWVELTGELVDAGAPGQVTQMSGGSD